MIKISFIIPCFNSEQTLDDTLRSIYNQHYHDWEALIINDGSLDDTAIIAKNWVIKDKRFKYFEKRNGGLASARNYGIEKSSGSYIIPMDSDNLVMPDFVSESLTILEKSPNVDVIYGNAEYYWREEWRLDYGYFNNFEDYY